MSVTLLQKISVSNKFCSFDIFLISSIQFFFLFFFYHSLHKNIKHHNCFKIDNKKSILSTKFSILELESCDTED